jgi:hypothetical protein
MAKKNLFDRTPAASSSTTITTMDSTAGDLKCMAWAGTGAFV